MPDVQDKLFKLFIEGFSGDGKNFDERSSYTFISKILECDNVWHNKVVHLAWKNINTTDRSLEALRFSQQKLSEITGKTYFYGDDKLQLQNTPYCNIELFELYLMLASENITDIDIDYHNYKVYDSNKKSISF